MPGTEASLAFAADEPVGFILARQAADEAEIVTIGTRPFAQRSGVATALLDHQFLAFRAHGAKSCFIEVARSNVPGFALYGKCGFRETGVRRGYYARDGGLTEDAAVLRKDLSP